MALLNCSGKDVATGSPVEVAFRDSVLSVTPASAPADLYLAPGWIDLQVNGFAAVTIVSGEWFVRCRQPRLRYGGIGTREEIAT
ncbi:MAG: hypothetical protein ABSH44_13940 [Bryobacteraceae bacterium]